MAEVASFPALFSRKGSLGQCLLGEGVTTNTFPFVRQAAAVCRQQWPETALQGVSCTCKLPQSSFLFPHCLAQVLGPFPSASTRTSGRDVGEGSAGPFSCTEAGLGTRGRGWLGSLGNKELTDEMQTLLILDCSGLPQQRGALG